MTTVYHWDRNSADTWVWPVNEPVPDGWPKNGCVHLTDIEVMLSDIQRLWPDSKGANQAGDTVVLGDPDSKGANQAGDTVVLGEPDSKGANQAGDTAVLGEVASSGGTPNVQATVKQETDAVSVLASYLKANPKSRRVDAAEWCRKAGYNLGKRSFDRVWPQAREDAGLPRIGSPGRKRKLTC